MEHLTLTVALVLAGATLGWTAFFSFIVSPQAFRDLDAGRANRFVRNAMKNGHPTLAALAFASAVLALLGAAFAGAGVMAVAGGMYLMATWALAPRDDALPPPGGKRKLATARIVAAGLTAGIMGLVLIGIALIAVRV